MLGCSSCRPPAIAEERSQLVYTGCVGSRAHRDLGWGLLALMGCSDDVELIPGSSSTEPGAVSTASTSLGSGSEDSASTGTTAADGSTTATVSATAASSTGHGGSSGSGSSGSGSSSSRSSETGDRASSSSGADPPAPVCVDQDLRGVLGPVFGDTSLAFDEFMPPCPAGVGGPDRGHQFIAPASGFYAFDTLDTVGLDTVLYALAGVDCAGAALACNDDAALGVPQSRISMFLPQDEAVVLVVDGYDDTQAGPYVLDIDAVLGPCHQIDLGAMLPVSAFEDTSAGFDKLRGSCAEGGAPDLVFRWEAPHDGSFTVDTVGSTFDTVLYLLDSSCGATELACDDDGAGGLQSELSFTRMAGEVTTIVVDGFIAGEAGIVQINVYEPA